LTCLTPGFIKQTNRVPINGVYVENAINNINVNAIKRLLSPDFVEAMPKKQFVNMNENMFSYLNLLLASEATISGTNIIVNARITNFPGSPIYVMTIGLISQKALMRKPNPSPSIALTIIKTGKKFCLSQTWKSFYQLIIFLKFECYLNLL